MKKLFSQLSKPKSAPVPSSAGDVEPQLSKPKSTPVQSFSRDGEPLPRPGSRGPSVGQLGAERTLVTNGSMRRPRRPRETLDLNYADYAPFAPQPPQQPQQAQQPQQPAKQTQLEADAELARQLAMQESAAAASAATVATPPTPPQQPVPDWERQNEAKFQAELDQVVAESIIQADYDNILRDIKLWIMDLTAALGDVEAAQGQARKRRADIDALLATLNPEDGEGVRKARWLSDCHAELEARLQDLGWRLRPIGDAVQKLSDLDDYIRKEQPPVSAARDDLDRIIAQLLEDLNIMGFAFHHPVGPLGRQGEGGLGGQDPLRELVQSLIEESKRMPPLPPTPASPAEPAAMANLIELDDEEEQQQQPVLAPKPELELPIVEPEPQQEQTWASFEEEVQVQVAEVEQHPLEGLPAAEDIEEAAAAEAEGELPAAEAAAAVEQEVEKKEEQDAPRPEPEPEVLPPPPPLPLPAVPEPAAQQPLTVAVAPSPLQCTPSRSLSMSGGSSERSASPTPSTARSAARPSRPKREHKPVERVRKFRLREAVKPQPGDAIKRLARVVALSHELQKGVVADAVGWNLARSTPPSPARNLSNPTGYPGSTSPTRTMSGAPAKFSPAMYPTRAQPSSSRREAAAASVAAGQEATADGQAPAAAEAEQPLAALSPAELAQCAAEVAAFKPSSPSEVSHFVADLKARGAGSACAAQEALAAAGWPAGKWAVLEEAAQAHDRLWDSVELLSNWEVNSQAGTVAESRRLGDAIDAASKRVALVAYDHCPLRVRMSSHGLPWSPQLVVDLRWAAQHAAAQLMTFALESVKAVGKSKRWQASMVLQPLGHAALAAFKVHQFCGGLNNASTALFDQVAEVTTHYARMIDHRWLRDTKWA